MSTVHGLPVWCVNLFLNYVKMKGVGVSAGHSSDHTKSEMEYCAYSFCHVRKVAGPPVIEPPAVTELSLAIQT